MIPALFVLKPQNAALNFASSVGKVAPIASKPSALWFSVSVDRKQTLQLSTEHRPLEKLRGVVCVAPDDGPSAQGTCVGELRYLEAFTDPLMEGGGEDESFWLDVRLARPQFDEVLAAARLGRVPSTIAVRVEGAEYGKWDNKTKAQLEVLSADFHIPVIVEPPDDDDEDAPARQARMPPTRAHFEALFSLLKGHQAEIATGFGEVAIRLRLLSVTMLGLGIALMLEVAWLLWR